MSIFEAIVEGFATGEEFTIADAVVAAKSQTDKPHSVRARLFEGVLCGQLDRVTRGVYRVTNKEGAECLILQGDGRDLSFIEDKSIDAIVTDHPYDMSISHNGGNRQLVDYECFRYTQADFDEKARVLKDGAFLVEFFPEENGHNWKYLADIKKMAEKAGFEYYAKVPWEKEGFVANMGRKSKNTEDVMFFSLGKARPLRPDNQQSKKHGKARFMSGTALMLPCTLVHKPLAKSVRSHKAEKPISLLREIIACVTVAGETVLDQFCGSGVCGDAALSIGRNAVLVEADEATVRLASERMKKSFC